jgi:signal transduction histidine kinase
MQLSLLAPRQAFFARMRDMLSLRPSPRRPLGLKGVLMLRLTGVSFFCFLLTSVFVLFENHQQSQQAAERLLVLLARQFDRQQIWAAAGLGTPQAEDLEAIAEHIDTSGHCLGFYDPEGRRTWAHCVGFDGAGAAVPGWFALVYSSVFQPGHPLEQTVSYRDAIQGKVAVEPAPAAIISAAWREMTHLITLTASITLMLCVMIYFVIGRALRPLEEVTNGMERFGDGDLTCRLPAFRLEELQRIGTVFNGLADRLTRILAERAELNRRLADAREQEQRSLARELHDEFAQNLTAISAIAASIRAGCDQPAIRAESESLSQIVQSMMTALRGTLARLRPAEIGEIGLQDSLHRLIAGWNARCNDRPRFELEIMGRTAGIPPETAAHIFRIAQEAVTNAARHSGASLVRVRFMAGPSGTLELIIEDDGKGSAGPPPAGLGLIGMRERVEALSGTIRVGSCPGAGLKVWVTIPAASIQAPVL